jgi:hypothetical protein
MAETWTPFRGVALGLEMGGVVDGVLLRGETGGAVQQGPDAASEVVDRTGKDGADALAEEEPGAWIDVRGGEGELLDRGADGYEKEDRQRGVAQSQQGELTAGWGSQQR